MPENNVVPMHASPSEVVPEDWQWDGSKWVCSAPGHRPIPPWGPWGPPWFGPQEPPWYPGANGGVTFSRTEPKHPIRGHFWFNGTTLNLFDGAGWIEFTPTASGVTPASAEENNNNNKKRRK